MKLKFLVSFMLLTLVLSGCAAGKSVSEAVMDGDFAPGAMPMEPQYAEELGMDMVYEESATSSNNQLQANGIERIVIRNADLSIVVDEPAEAMNTIGRMAERMGGYIVSSNTWKTSNYQGVEIPEANISVRVPSELLNQALEEIKSLLNNKELDLLN